MTRSFNLILFLTLSFSAIIRADEDCQIWRQYCRGPYVCGTNEEYKEFLSLPIPDCAPPPIDFDPFIKPDDDTCQVDATGGCDWITEPEIDIPFSCEENCCHDGSVQQLACQYLGQCSDVECESPIDCSLVLCAPPTIECPLSQRPVLNTDTEECCDFKCIPDCRLVRCSAPQCQQGETPRMKTETPECCDYECVPDCSLVRCSEPQCQHGETPRMKTETPECCDYECIPDCSTVLCKKPSCDDGLIAEFDLETDDCCDYNCIDPCADAVCAIIDCMPGWIYQVVQPVDPAAGICCEEARCIPPRCQGVECDAIECPSTHVLQTSFNDASCCPIQTCVYLPDPDCHKYFDGCNTCWVDDQGTSCTEMACEELQEGKCLDMDCSVVKCGIFCEDGSEPVNIQDPLPGECCKRFDCAPKCSEECPEPECPRDFKVVKVDSSEEDCCPEYKCEFGPDEDCLVWSDGCNDCSRTELGVICTSRPCFEGQVEKPYCKQRKPALCGGIAGIECPDGLTCVDDPNDDCDPQQGGADCGGICVDAPNDLCPVNNIISPCVITDDSCMSDEQCDDDLICCSRGCGKLCVKPCEPVLCRLYCEHGFDVDENGCEICKCKCDDVECKQPPICPDNYRLITAPGLPGDCCPTYECIFDPSECSRWFDGCNTCFRTSDGTIACTKMYCPPESLAKPFCYDKPPTCGGIAGIECPDGLTCVDDPNDDCDPQQGDADCGGICVDECHDECPDKPDCGGICVDECHDECPDKPECPDTHDLIEGESDKCGCATFQCVFTPDDDCDSWFDGCNFCSRNEDDLVICTLRYCPNDSLQEGFCLDPPPMCGGIASLQCPKGMICVDIPDDDCDPLQGGADCPSQCIKDICDCPDEVPDCPSTHDLVSYQDRSICGCTHYRCVYTPDEDCKKWFDGCNYCTTSGCTEKYCQELTDGYCIEPAQPCGGFMGSTCPGDLICVDDPSDDCDPENGGADCIGMCVIKPPCPGQPECPWTHELIKMKNAETGCVEYDCVYEPVNPDCLAWFDGCNICTRNPADDTVSCTRKFCPLSELQIGYCRDPRPTLCGGNTNQECDSGFDCYLDPLNPCAGTLEECAGICLSSGSWTNPLCPSTAGFDICISNCENDDNCENDQICCQNACGGLVCTEPCEPVLCDRYCEHGFEVDENGCEICECKDAEDDSCDEKCPSQPECPASHNIVTVGVDKCGCRVFQCEFDSSNCNSWFDGCNSCTRQSNGVVICTLRACSIDELTDAYCTDPPQTCGGIAGIECPDGLTCVDDPNDDCDPQQGDADCAGICQVKPCDPFLCRLYCGERGYKQDENGCDICECRESCDHVECDAPPKCPSTHMLKTFKPEEPDCCPIYECHYEPEPSCIFWNNGCNECRRGDDDEITCDDRACDELNEGRCLEHDCDLVECPNIEINCKPDEKIVLERVGCCDEPHCESIHECDDDNDCEEEGEYCRACMDDDDMWESDFSSVPRTCGPLLNQGDVCASMIPTCLPAKCKPGLTCTAYWQDPLDYLIMDLPSICCPELDCRCPPTHVSVPDSNGCPTCECIPLPCEDAGGVVPHNICESGSDCDSGNCHLFDDDQDNQFAPGICCAQRRAKDPTVCINGEDDLGNACTCDIEGCGSCTLGENPICRECASGYMRVNDECVAFALCRDGFYANTDQQCVCPDNCVQCIVTASGSQCQVCQSKFFLHDRECTRKCPENLVGVNDPESDFGGECMTDIRCLNSLVKKQKSDIHHFTCKCPPGCKECRYSNNEPPTCQSCKSAKFLHQEQCIAKCPDTLTHVGEKWSFRECKEEFWCTNGVSSTDGSECTCPTRAGGTNCLHCHFHAGNKPRTAKCRRCQPPLVNYWGKCYKKCPGNLTPNASGRCQ